MDLAIKKAQEGGYPSKLYFETEEYRILHYTNDSAWWQALGKSLGKEQEYTEFTIWRSLSSGDIVKTLWWIAQWHMFVDHLAEGKEVDSFFNQLLK